MALIKCPECGNMVSQFASSCSCCGIPMRLIIDLQKYNNVDDIDIPYTQYFGKFMVDGNKVLSMNPYFDSIMSYYGYDNAVKLSDPPKSNAAVSNTIDKRQYIISMSIWNANEIHIDLHRNDSKVPLVFNIIKDDDSLDTFYDFAESILYGSAVIPLGTTISASLTSKSKDLMAYNERISFNDNKLVSFTVTIELTEIDDAMQLVIRETEVREELREGKTYYDEFGMKNWDMGIEKVPTTRIYSFDDDVCSFLSVFLEIYDAIYNN